MQPLLFRRLWILSLMAGLERAGACPISLKQLNGVIYLANATTPCFEIESLDSIVRKSGEGPLYPQAIWDIDRLVGAGLLIVSGLVVQPSFEHSGMYSISREGLAVVKRARSVYGGFDQLASALWRIAMSFAEAPSSVAAESLLGRDANYAQPSIPAGDVVDFGEWEIHNWTREAVARIQDKSLERLRIESVEDIPPGLRAAVSGPASALDLYAQFLSNQPGKRAGTDAGE